MMTFLFIAGCANPFGGGSYNGPVQCAPYARQVSGINLRGAAASWWWQAKGRYRRSHQPVPGAVLVFRATRRVPDGHVSVVKRRVSERRILVDQANWVPGKIEHSVVVEDVSPTSDWTQVRVWWAPSDVLGRRIYATYGFILPNR
ncbi:CHAP domain-containing protein [Saccharibacter sp. 17.LH.SD]|uniref:CHAP domain-containing protein n=1 Tax=Saccharibacter sp. 17.LH.SD TaxID=2689393 RepID=UPI00351AC2E4